MHVWVLHILMFRHAEHGMFVYVSHRQHLHVCMFVYMYMCFPMHSTLVKFIQDLQYVVHLRRYTCTCVCMYVFLHVLILRYTEYVMFVCACMGLCVYMLDSYSMCTYMQIAVCVLLRVYMYMCT